MGWGSSIIAAVLVALGAVTLVDILPYSGMPCDPSADPTCPDAFFSESYFHARASFREAAEAAGALTESLAVYTDPETGLDFTMEVAIFPAKTPRGVDPSTAPLLVHMSGVHGVEGFAGSAVQIAALRRIAASRGATNHATSGEQAEERTTLCFVHAVNPYGFATLRRFNENNVDLNRNNLSPEQWAKALARDPNFARYADFDGMFNPTALPQWYARFTVLLHAARALHANSFGALKRAIVTGQYHKPSGVYFGGSGYRESSLVVLQGFVRKRFPAPSSVVVLDVHTGLGPPGMDSMLVSSEKDKAVALAFLKTAHAVESPFSEGADASAGYEDVLGTGVLHGAWNRSEVPVLEVVQEFGTVPGVLVARAMILENAAHNAARGSPQHELTRRLLKGAFLVPTRKWKASVVERGLAAVHEAAGHLSLTRSGR